MNSDSLAQVLASGEGQTTEFKESLTTGRQQEGIQSLVAFANTDGGRVLFGVRDDGTLKGVELGSRTLEDLGLKVAAHTYPSLAVSIDVARGGAGENVVVVEAPKDRPPVVGVYVYSEQPLALDRDVKACAIQGYRRVGRMNMKEDFMRLRPPLASDPRLRLQITDTQAYDGRQGLTYFVHGSVWVEEGSGTAHSLGFFCDSDAFVSDESYPDLPYVQQPRYEETSFQTAATFQFTCPALSDLFGAFIRFGVSYRDDWGLTWESSRLYQVVRIRQGDIDRPQLDDRAAFRRRISVLPAKVLPA